MKRVVITPLSEPARATLSIPGSKSYTNRALLLAALTEGVVSIKNPLVSDDTHAMITCLRQLGIRCAFRDDSLEVEGGIGGVADHAYDLNVNLSGTTMRFLLALAALVPGTKTIRGRGRLNERPIAHLVESLRQIGARIEYVDKEGYPPVRVLPSKLQEGTVTMRGDISSQFLSALLMVAPLIGNLAIEVEGKQISRPYIDMTIEAMKEFGVKASNRDYKHYVVKGGQRYRAHEYTVEGDMSSASYFFAIAALTRSSLTLRNMNPRSIQADLRFLKILERMGSTVESGTGEVTIRGAGVKALSVDMRDCPDQAQTLAVLAAFAEGKTTIKGIASLRIKETERVAAVETELAKMGIKTESAPDTLVIHGGTPRSARIDTYDDHRMAMAFSVAGAALAGMSINDPDVVSKTFPHFWDALSDIGVGIDIRYENPNVVLIGMRGGGKTTVSKLLSEQLGRPYLDVDEELARRAGMSISEMVEKYGWDYFRDRESDVVRDISRRHGTIIATGGGVIIRPENIAALKTNGFLIYINAAADILASRIDLDPGRPALTDASSTEQEVEAILAERKKLYEAAADEVVEDINLSPKKKAGEVLRILQARGIIGG